MHAYAVVFGFVIDHSIATENRHTFDGSLQFGSRARAVLSCHLSGGRSDSALQGLYRIHVALNFKEMTLTGARECVCVCE